MSKGYVKWLIDSVVLLEMPEYVVGKPPKPVGKTKVRFSEPVFGGDPGYAPQDDRGPGFYVSIKANVQLANGQKHTLTGAVKLPIRLQQASDICRLQGTGFFRDPGMWEETFKNKFKGEIDRLKAKLLKQVQGLGPQDSTPKVSYDLTHALQPFRHIFLEGPEKNATTLEAFLQHKKSDDEVVKIMYTPRSKWALDIRQVLILLNPQEKPAFQAACQAAAKEHLYKLMTKPK
jgi:hypothetical protein